MSNPLEMMSADSGPEVEKMIALDIVRRSLPFLPFVCLIASIPWGFAGAASAAYGFALVLLNFLLAAALLTWSARISFAALGAAALFGYLLRLGLITIAVLLVKDQPWVELVALGVTIIVTHLGLLLWELRFISTSFTYPGLKAGVRGSAAPAPQTVSPKSATRSNPSRSNPSRSNPVEGASSSVGLKE
jgi:hypothetical protein